ncbi:hypothetical protein HDU96_000013 [Phlyctochytrium bullatum]|nr:hypothetical protein HDU96_000013 [Phlyctochytrium bullatum]
MGRESAGEPSKTSNSGGDLYECSPVGPTIDVDEDQSISSAVVEAPTMPTTSTNANGTNPPSEQAFSLPAGFAEFARVEIQEAVPSKWADYWDQPSPASGITTAEAESTMEVLSPLMKLSPDERSDSLRPPDGGSISGLGIRKKSVGESSMLARTVSEKDRLMRLQRPPGEENWSSSQEAIGQPGIGRLVDKRFRDLNDCSPYNSMEDLPMDSKETEAKLKRVILKLRGDWQMLPLFNELLGCNFKTNLFLKSLAPENTRKFLSKAIVSLFKNAGTFLKSRVCIVLDNLQWQDSLSWQLTLEDYDPSMKPFLAAAIQSSACVVINFNSLEYSEVEKFIIYHFSDLGVEKVDPRLVNEVMQKTNGNCYVLETVCKSIKESMTRRAVKSSNEEGTFSHLGGTEIVIRNGNTLTFQSGTAKLQNIIENFLPNEKNASVLIQYDRLNPKFQRILAVASCIGQTFNLRTLWEVCSREEGTVEVLGYCSPDTLKAIIKSEDIFSFLVPLGSRRMSFESTVIGQKNSYRFRHILIQKSIYSTLLSQDKEVMHLAMADYLEESVLNEYNEYQTLPLISSHLGLVQGLSDRKLQIYLKLFDLHHSASSAIEGLDMFKKIEVLLETENIPLERIKRCDILRKAAELYLCLQDMEEARRLAFLAITYMDVNDDFRWFYFIKECDGGKLDMWFKLFDIIHISNQSYIAPKISFFRMRQVGSTINWLFSRYKTQKLKFTIFMIAVSEFFLSIDCLPQEIALSICHQKPDSISLCPKPESSKSVDTMSNKAFDERLSHEQERLMEETTRVVLGLGYNSLAALMAYELRKSLEVARKS